MDKKVSHDLKDNLWQTIFFSNFEWKAYCWRKNSSKTFCWALYDRTNIVDILRIADQKDTYRIMKLAYSLKHCMKHQLYEEKRLLIIARIGFCDPSYFSDQLFKANANVINDSYAFNLHKSSSSLKQKFCDILIKLTNKQLANKSVKLLSGNL